MGPIGHESGVRSMETTHRSLLMLRCKVVVVGDSTVGKSALVSMFHSGGSSYPKQYVMTAWVDFRVKQVNIPNTSTAVELYIFDCAGQSIFNQIEANNVRPMHQHANEARWEKNTQVHYENASYLMLVYDVSSQSSFESCGKWLQQTRLLMIRVPGVLVANKKDLVSANRRCISRDKGEAFAAANGLVYFETSALEGEFENPFKYIADEFANKYEETIARAETTN